MGLHRTHGRLKPGFPELLGVLLLAGTVASCGLWYGRIQRETRWVRTTATIMDVSIAGEGAALNLQYSYAIGGVRYTGSTEPGLVRRTLASLLPTSIMNRLDAEGIHSLEDLPENVRKALSENSGYTFDDVPEAERRDLEAMGYRSLDDVRVALLAALGTLELAGSLVGDSSLGSDLFSRDGGGRPLTVRILYNPSNPGQNRADLPGSRSGVARVAALLFAGALTCLYFSTVYPWLKAQDY